MDEFMKKVVEENSDLFPSVFEWIEVGWELPDPPSPEQIAAALLMEARTQDDYVEAGETIPEYPKRLRQLAFSILNHYHGAKL